MVHVPEDHQRHGALGADLLDRLGQVLVAPVAGGRFPVAAAGIAGLAAEATRTAVGKQNEGQTRVGRKGRCSDAPSRLSQFDRTPERLYRFGEVVAATGAARPSTHNGKAGGSSRRRAQPQCRSPSRSIWRCSLRPL